MQNIHNPEFSTIEMIVSFIDKKWQILIDEQKPIMTIICSSIEEAFEFFHLIGDFLSCEKKVVFNGHFHGQLITDWTIQIEHQ